jgi:3-deoxy-D-manno-octulosonate 8-phosphate phosphatase (KDO 8-P phosphatase)
MDDIVERMKRVSFIVTDFDGVLSDGRVWFDGDGEQFRWLHARDATALTLWRLTGGKAAMVSGLGCKAMEVISMQWKFVESHMWIRDKARVCREIAERQNIPLAQMAFLGDDIIDMNAIKIVGLGVVVANAGAEVKEAASLVLDAPGGMGAMRELVERILRAKGLLDEAINMYCGRKDGPQ